MSSNIFFKRKGPFCLSEIFKEKKFSSKIKIYDIKPLDSAGKNDLSFLDSLRYKDISVITKAGICVTTEKLKKYLPKTCKIITVKNVLFDLALIVKKFYPDADTDSLDTSLKKPNSSSFKDVKFGNNVLIGKNVKIGKNTFIKNNTIIEQNVVIGKNCIIGSDVTLKNTFLDDNVIIQDGCKIGLKGFGFIPLKSKNIKFPHIGKVIIKKDVEIASSCTIDRGSIDDTIIGQNTYLDNQVHVAHNVKIGKNCMIAGQVGFAGSSTIGNDVSIGGQAGISGHLSIGNNVKIAGGSGVIKDIEDNQVVMGYPAIPLKDFIKKWKK